MLRFDDQVALITGAGRGIGRQHALLLASRGARIVVNDYGVGLRGGERADPTLADSVVAEIEAAGGCALAACCDIGDATAARAMVAQALERFGRLDIVIHNASVYAPLSAFADADVEPLGRILHVNVTGGWNVAQAAWRSMTARGYGRIIMTGSGAGFFGRRRDHAYSIAKSALIAFTKGLATEGAALGIKANLVGPIAFTDHASQQGIPALMEKFAPPICVSNLVALLAHEACPVTGEMFHCGGGFISRVFVGETPGTVLPAETMTPEAVLAEMDRIMDVNDAWIPGNSDRSGARVSAALAAASAEFAAALAASKRDHPPR
jgi:NAD(P)-dependent dehydrogenase (short-subunit alcohol dehydrogenase family)